MRATAATAATAATVATAAGASPPPRPLRSGRHHPTLLDVFRLSLQTEQQMPVRNAALKALASFLLAVELKAERQPFQELVPAMLQTIADALTASEEEQCRDALEVCS